MNNLQTKAYSMKNTSTVKRLRNRWWTIRRIDRKWTRGIMELWKVRSRIEDSPLFKLEL